MTYELKQYDDVLMKFRLERTGLGDVFSIEWVKEGGNLPIGLTPDPDSLSSWLSSRVIPKNREFVDRILSKSGLSQNDTIGIIQLCKGLSLNDSYWVVEEGFSGRFRDYNLFENRFTRTLAFIAYTGYGSTTRKGFTSSPEFTTNGMLRKCWRRIDGKIYLYKGGTFGAANAGKEPYSEFYAAQIAERMGLRHVEYGLSRWKGSLCSTCELFTDIDTSYVPLHRFMPNITLPRAVEFLKSLGGSFYDDFADMMIFDSIIMNTDRHFGNFGLLVENAGNKPISLAPVFDNGLSLFNYAMEDDLRDVQGYSKTRSPAFQGVSYDDLVSEFLSDRQREKVRKLINFRFRKHPRYNLPDDRLKLLEAFLQTRVVSILNTKK